MIGECELSRPSRYNAMSQVGCTVRTCATEREGMIATVDGKFERIGSVLERAFEAGCEDSGLAARVKEGGQ